MPRVLEWDGFVFFFFSNEGNPLERRHIHIRKAGNLAKVWLDPMIEVAGNNGFSAVDLHRIITRIEENPDFFRRKWDEFFKRS